MKPLAAYFKNLKARLGAYSEHQLDEMDQYQTRKVLAAFSERYADQNERDYQAFVEAIRSGRLQALEGVLDRAAMDRT